MANISELLIELLAFAAVFAGVFVAERAVGSYLAVRRRLGHDVTARSSTPSSVLKSDTISNRFLVWVQSATAPKDSKEGGTLRRNLSLAGFNHPSAPAWYVICRFSLAVGLPVLLILGTRLLGKPMAGLGAIIMPLLACGLGMMAPNSFVKGRAEARRAEMERQFPDALDLLVVCVEAGLGMESAFVRVATEVRESHPRVAEEFGRMADELSAGRGRADALRALADRVSVDSVKAFVALLIQTDALGVSIAQSLRTYSTEMRESRFAKAEEKAMRIPVLLTLPVTACFMPVIVMAVMLPPGIDLARNLLPALSASPATAQAQGPRPGGAP
jgi:tight adherence protein C